MSEPTREDLMDALVEQTDLLAAAHAELVDLRAIVDSDDRLAAANARISRLSAEVAALRSRVAGLMTECAEAKRAAQSWASRARQLERQKEAS